MRRGRHHPKHIRRKPDVAKIANAVRSAGIDPRNWIAHGVVGVTTEDGNFDVTNPDAIQIEPEGIIVDVQVVTFRGEVWPITCRFNGIDAGGGLQILTPIRPGDEVLVAFPGGTLENGVIIGRASNPVDTIKVDDSTGEPEWQNDRILLFSREPLSIQAPAVNIEADMIQLNGRAVTDVLDDI